MAHAIFLHRVRSIPSEFRTTHETASLTVLQRSSGGSASVPNVRIAWPLPGTMKNSSMSMLASDRACFARCAI